MFDEMILLKGRSWAVFVLSCTRYSSALMASSPRTAYWTLRIAGFSASTVSPGILLLLKGRKKKTLGEPRGTENLVTFRIIGTIGRWSPTTSGSVRLDKGRYTLESYTDDRGTSYILYDRHVGELMLTSVDAKP